METLEINNMLNLNNENMEVLDLTEFLIKYGDIDE